LDAPRSESPQQALLDAAHAGQQLALIEAAGRAPGGEPAPPFFAFGPRLERCIPHILGLRSKRESHSDAKGTI
jgi:hypothetical protein